MRKKSINPAGDSVFSAEKFLLEGKRTLSVPQIRDLKEVLELLPDGELLPNWSHLSVGDRLAVVRRLVPKGSLEELTGKSDSQLQRYEIEPAIPLHSLAALVSETQIPLDWILTGRAMKRRPADESQPDHDDVPVQKLAFKAAAGHGSLIIDDDAEYVRIPHFVLTQARVAPQHARLWEAAGHSMKDTINDGDLMLVDVSPSAQQIIEGKIYVFSIGDDAFVKRLRRMGDDVIMISDNREMFPEETVPKDSSFRIYGLVRWSSKFH